MKPPFFTFTVAPLTVLPFQKTLFTYGYNQKLSTGSIVTIPLSGRTVQGVVLAMAPYPNKTTPAWLKNIISTEERPPLTENQLALAEEVSNITFTPLGRVLKHFVPKQAKVRKVPEIQNPPLRFPTKPSPAIEEALTLLKKDDTVFLPLSPHASSLDALFSLVIKLKKKQGQILILTPDIASAARIEKAWEPYQEAETLVSLYHTKTPGQYFEAWNRIQEGSAQIIIATRHGLFAPFKNLTAIIQLDPNDESYKQWDMSPRYHTESVLPVLQNMWDAKLIKAAVIPLLSVIAEKISSPAPLSSPVQPEWINLKIERYQKNWSAFSKGLEAAMREALTEKKQILLYVHQGGLESFSVCKECRTIFRCPSCQSALKLTSSDHYQCSHCGFRSSLFPQCPQCKNIDFKSVGYGTEKVAREVRKVFPGAEVAITDKKHLEDHKKVRKFLESTEKKEPDILITTASFLRFPPLSQLVLVAIIDADTLLNLPGFRKDEQFVELIEKAKSLLEPNGRLLVQTYHPHSDIFQKIDLGDTPKLLETLLEERTLLHYPPVYRALTLEARPKKKDGVELLRSATRKVKELIDKHPDKKILKKSILIQAATRKERGKEVPYTLIRYQPPLHPALTDFLAKQADHIFIDHDPLRIT